MQNRPLIIIAAGGQAAEIAAFAADMGLNLLGALDDMAPIGPWQDTKILGRVDDLPKLVAVHGPTAYITALGNNAARLKIVSRLNEFNLGDLLLPATLKHHLAWTGIGVNIGAGTLLAPNAIVTTRTNIGNHCILNIKSSVSHDCEIGDFCNINPDATICGNVRIGNSCYVGAGAIIKEKISIGAGATIGAGAVVIRDVPDGATVVGVPAQPIVKSKDLDRKGRDAK